MTATRIQEKCTLGSPYIKPYIISYYRCIHIIYTFIHTHIMCIYTHVCALCTYLYMPFARTTSNIGFDLTPYPQHATANAQKAFATRVRCLHRAHISGTKN